MSGKKLAIVVLVMVATSGLDKLTVRIYMYKNVAGPSAYSSPTLDPPRLTGNLGHAYESYTVYRAVRPSLLFLFSVHPLPRMRKKYIFTRMMVD